MPDIGTPGTTPSAFSTLDAGAFAKCAPSLRTNIRQCGTVTQMNAAVPTVDELATMFQKSNDFRVMEALFHHDMEIKMCEPVQNGLYDFFMAQKVNMSHRLNTKRLSRGLIEIAPFVMARQYSPINDEWWLATGGKATSGAAQDGDTLTYGSATGSNWKVDVASTTNIPISLNYFPVGQRLFMQGKSTAGSATRTAWKVTGGLLNADGLHATIYLKGQNSNSALLPYLSDKLSHPTTALLQIGTPNVSDYEKWCSEDPTVLNWKNVPFWVETTRWSMCKSELYDKWRKLVLENGYYQEFFDLEEIERNKQLGAQWQKRLVRQMFWGKPLDNQDTTNYDDLEQITSFDGSLIGQSTGQISGLGADGASVIGRRANAVGIYEQLAACDRVVDLQGSYPLNLPRLFTELYNMMRIREGNNHANPKSFDLFTDSTTAELINQAMIAYYLAKAQNAARFNINVDTQPYKKAEFGFLYRSYQLFWPPGVTINVITHYMFDDWRAAGLTMSETDDTTRVLWVLDFTGIYPGIIASNRKVHNTGDLTKLAEISPDFACVMAVNTKQQTLTSMMWTMVVECPASNLIIENFNGEIPEHATASGPTYPPATSTTSATTLPY